jgi:opacity protein-like surface antigen
MESLIGLIQNCIKKYKACGNQIRIAMTIKKTLIAASLAALSFTTQAGTMGSYTEPRPWSVEGGLGYTWYNFGYHGGATADPTAQNAIGDGQTAFGRFALARNVKEFSRIHLGLELGVQSGNTMRLDISQATLDLLAGLPVQANIKPMLDLLVTATTNPSPLMSTPVYGVVKAGIAYRRMQINNQVTVNDLSQVGFEVQAGVGTAITDRARLALLYQGVFNGSTSFTYNAATDTGHVSNIPMQNGLLLALSYTL